MCVYFCVYVCMYMTHFSFTIVIKTMTCRIIVDNVDNVFQTKVRIFMMTMISRTMISIMLIIKSAPIGAWKRNSPHRPMDRQKLPHEPVCASVGWVGWSVGVSLFQVSLPMLLSEHLFISIISRILTIFIKLNRQMPNKYKIFT